MNDKPDEKPWGQGGVGKWDRINVLKFSFKRFSKSMCDQVIFFVRMQSTGNDACLTGSVQNIIM